ncbi:MAG: hypothetical protein FJW69_01790 [Actinobacteria bacterium]|nr:hypothetical protein [Actinomycetota bacterium]
MKSLTQKEIIEYLYQCYVKVDGLWFLKVEEQFGFYKALEIDKEVWKIVPKIQARFLKSKLNGGFSAKKNKLNDSYQDDNYKVKDNSNINLINNSNVYIESRDKNKGKYMDTENIGKKTIIKTFLKALNIKLKLDGFKFSISKNKDLVAVKITECPWHNILIRSKRGHLSEKIGSIICRTEYSVFASEFEPEIKLDLSTQICKNDECCNFNWTI